MKKTLWVALALAVGLTACRAKAQPTLLGKGTYTTADQRYGLTLAADGSFSDASIDGTQRRVREGTYHMNKAKTRATITVTKQAVARFPSEAQAKLGTAPLAVSQGATHAKLTVRQTAKQTQVGKLKLQRGGKVQTVSGFYTSALAAYKRTYGRLDGVELSTSGDLVSGDEGRMTIQFAANRFFATLAKMIPEGWAEDTSVASGTYVFDAEHQQLQLSLEAKSPAYLALVKGAYDDTAASAFTSNQILVAVVMKGKMITLRGEAPKFTTNREGEAGAMPTMSTWQKGPRKRQTLRGLFPTGDAFLTWYRNVTPAASDGGEAADFHVSANGQITDLEGKTVAVRYFIRYQWYPAGKGGPAEAHAQGVAVSDDGSVYTGAPDGVMTRNDELSASVQGKLN